jgi:hypothetical protein
MLTRGQKRRMGLRDLWDLIVNNDDICFEHILPKLNHNDKKFLYDVNSETRALIKRSPYSDAFEDEFFNTFSIPRMSSISTLEFAWNNMQWGALSAYVLPKDQAWFCFQVAQTNKLEFLKWAREEKKCEWNEWTIGEAARLGNLDMLKYCVANQCPMDEETCADAAEGGELECLKYLHEQVKAPWDWHTGGRAGKHGHLHILEYLVERKYDEFDEGACRLAAEEGHLDCLKFLHETAKAPWTSDAVYWAHKCNHPECVQYLLDNDCPLPRGWRYEHGKLYTLS